MSQALNRRFYKEVNISESNDGYQILLDGRVLKTPGKLPLNTMQKHVAHLIAKEWAAQDDLIRPDTMPVTRLVNVTLELTPKNRDKLIDEAKAYGRTDLLCYRAEGRSDLVQRQTDLWDPILEWSQSRGIALKTTQSISAIEQDPMAIEAIGQYASSKSDLELTLFIHLTAVYGSVILALAVMERHLAGSRAFELSRLDALYQIEKWGEDEEAAENAAGLKAEVVALCNILEGA